MRVPSLACLLGVLVLLFAPTAAFSQDDIPAPPKLGPAVLGAGEESVELVLERGPTESDGDWRFYGESVAVRYEALRAVELVVRVPDDMSCAEAATWLGYPSSTPPLRKKSRCLWPGISPKHRLSGGISGDLNLDTATFSVKLLSSP